MSRLYNISSSPHVRSRLTTGEIMYKVILCLLPAAAVGVWRHGLHALLIIAAAVAAAMLTEFAFERATGRPDTLKDGSAAVTGLLLALCLPAGVPLYVPVVGSVFAILFVKCFFGGLGHNFMNPALAGRCFLLISFSGIVANYTSDGFSSATPLADLAAGNPVNALDAFLGLSNGVIGSSALALLAGGVILWLLGGITLEIPAATLLSFCLFVGLFGEQGFDSGTLFLHLSAGGIVMGAFFMATDPVTSPVTSGGQILYGILIGLLGGMFRVFGSSADSVSYAIIIANMFTPLIDEISVPVPFGCRKQKDPSAKRSLIPVSAVILCVITLIAGVCLSGVYEMTKDIIAEQQLAAKIASYKEVCPDAEEFASDAGMDAAIAALDGEVYGVDFGRSYINEAVVGTDASGNTAGYVISVTSRDAYDGSLTLSVGVSADGTVSGIAFTELNETAGMGMLCGEDAFKDQFKGVNVERFTLNKAGGSSADDEIDSVSGASTTSGAVVNAVNAALDFCAANVK